MEAVIPRKSPRQDRSRRLVSTILDASARILQRDGYARLNTNAVAEAAGVSIGSLYQYFANKDALAIGVVERHGRAMHEAIIAAVGVTAPATLAEAVRRIVAAVANAHRLNAELHAVLEAEMPKFCVFDGHTGTVSAIAEQLAALPPTIRAEMHVQDHAHAAAMVGEMIHALIHAAFIPPMTTNLSPGEIEVETVRAVLAYLTFGEVGATSFHGPHGHSH